MFSCLRGSDSLPPGQSLPSECGAPLQMLLDQPRIVQMNVARLIGIFKIILVIRAVIIILIIITTIITIIITNIQVARTCGTKLSLVHFLHSPPLAHGGGDGGGLLLRGHDRPLQEASHPLPEDQRSSEGRLPS